MKQEIIYISTRNFSLSVAQRATSSRWIVRESDKSDWGGQEEKSETSCSSAEGLLILLQDLGPGPQHGAPKSLSDEESKSLGFDVPN